MQKPDPEAIGASGVEAFDPVDCVLTFCVARSEVAGALLVFLRKEFDLDLRDFELLDALGECPPSREQFVLLGQRLDLSDSSLRRRIGRLRDAGWLTDDAGSGGEPASGGVILAPSSARRWRDAIERVASWSRRQLDSVPQEARSNHLKAVQCLAGRLCRPTETESLADMETRAKESVRFWTQATDTPEPLSLANVMELIRSERTLTASIRRIAETSGVGLERADLLMVLARGTPFARSVSGTEESSRNLPAGGGGWMSLQRLQRSLVHSPWIAQAQFSRWLSELREAGLVEVIRPSETGLAATPRGKAARITKDGVDRLRPFWEALVQLCLRLTADLPTEWIRSTLDVHSALAAQRLSRMVRGLPEAQPILPRPTGRVPMLKEQVRGFSSMPPAMSHSPRAMAITAALRKDPADEFLKTLRSLGGWATHEELQGRLNWPSEKYGELLALLQHRSCILGSPGTNTVRLREIEPPDSGSSLFTWKS